MKKRIAVILTVVLAFAGLRATAQDAMFSQYYANPLYLNPAFAGTNVCPRSHVAGKTYSGRLEDFQRSL